MNQDTSQNNPLLCDPTAGACAIPGAETSQNPIPSQVAQTLKVVYFTDPICSSCWGIEPQLRKLKLEYGANLQIEYRMGGLLPDWSYNSGGISKPGDVALHWDEASAYYDMPIDGNIWLEDPLDSSYPPSIAFKAAQLQDSKKALEFLRLLREYVFLEKKNIANWAHIQSAAQEVGLNVTRLQTDIKGKAAQLFREDLHLAKTYGVRGFPTLFFTFENGTTETVYGSKPYAFYETAVLKLNEKAVKRTYDRDWKALFAQFPTLTAREFAELALVARPDAEKQLNELAAQGLLTKLQTRNGSIWKVVR